MAQALKCGEESKQSDGSISDCAQSSGSRGGCSAGRGLGTMAQLQQKLVPAFFMVLDWAAHQKKMHSSTCSSALGSWNAFVHEPFQGIMTPGWLGDCCACFALLSPGVLRIG